MISGMWRWRFVPEERAHLRGEEPVRTPGALRLPRAGAGAGAGAGRLREEAGEAAGGGRGGCGGRASAASACAQPAKGQSAFLVLACCSWMSPSKTASSVPLFTLQKAGGSESLVWGAMSSWCSVLAR